MWAKGLSNRVFRNTGWVDLGVLRIMLACVRLRLFAVSSTWSLALGDLSGRPVVATSGRDLGRRHVVSRLGACGV